MPGGASPSPDELEVLTRLRQRMLGLAAGATVAERYRLVRLLGQGGMGEVWLADDPRLARRVALKLLHERARHGASERLLREAQAIAQISHPNVVAVFDCGTVALSPDTEPRAFIAMEYLDGETLEAWLARTPRSTVEILAAFVAAGRGLAAAHRAGQIHRDFKPANVIVARDGRIKVLDFGLVLHDADSLSGSGAGSEARSASATDVVPRHDISGDGRLTEPGLVMGTPRYMSPEQHTGRPVSPAADQFAFCCALLEALQGLAPFEGRDYVELGRAKLDGRIQRPPASQLASGLRAVIERGLARDPARRWPTMEHLLRRLEPTGSRRPLVAAAAAVGLLAVAAFSRSDDRCAPHHAWSAERQRALDARLGEGDDADPERIAQIGAQLADYDGRLVAHEVASCEAHRAGVIDAAVFDRRIACLRDRRGDFAATARVLELLDATVDGRADAVVAGLPDPDACIDDERLAVAFGPPADPATELAVTLARGRLSTGRALMLAGKQREAMAAYEEAKAGLVGVDHPPVLAEIEHEIGRLGAEMGDPGAAAALERALMLAEGCGHDRVAAEVVSTLIYALTMDPSAHDRALALIARGDALLRRAGEPPVLRGGYWMAVGGLHLQRREWEPSLAAYERSFASLASVLPPEAPDVVVARANLGTILRNLRRYDEAIAHHREVLEIRERTMGPRHPRTLRALVNVALDLERAERFAEAEPLLLDAIERTELGLGPNHLDLAFALGAAARVSRRLGRFDDARVAYLRALAILEHRGAAETPDAATLLSNLGNLERQTDRLDEARTHLEQAIALRERLLGPRHYDVAHSMHTLAGVELLAGNPDRARALALDAAAIFEDATGATAGDRADAQVRIATALLELGRLEEARMHLRAAAAASPERDDVHLVALGRLALAQGDLTGALSDLHEAVEVATEPARRAVARIHLAAALRAARDAPAAAGALAVAKDELEAAGAAGRHGLRVWATVAGANPEQPRG